MTTDIHAAFEAKYKASAQDPACAEELRHFTDGWNAAREGCGSGREAFERWALQALRQDATNWKHPDGTYVYLQSEWDAWQAATQARDAEIAALTKERDDARRAKTEHFSPAYLLANARRLAAPEYAMMPNWALATQLFAVGSTTAHAICRENGIDLDSKSAHEAVAVDAAPQHPRFPWREGQKIARQIRGDGGKERKG